jgi:hypothetical protein
MKKLLAVLLLAGALGGLSDPAPADAAVLDECLNETIASCDNDFSGNTERDISIRGWCYMIRWGICVWFD